MAYRYFKLLPGILANMIPMKRGKSASTCLFLILVTPMFVLFSATLASASGNINGDRGDPGFNPIDANATNTTVNLYRNLKFVSGNEVLFGHQDTTLVGVDANGSTWYFNPNRSDVKTITGSYPAVYGYDIGGIDLDTWENSSTPIGAWFHARLQHIVPDVIAAFDRGGVITLSWHCWNFATGGTFYDTNGSVVPKILPGGALHDDLTAALDRIAKLFGNLVDSKNRSIPILFRPWHECNIDAFWWCLKYCTPDEYKELYQFTVHYLKDIKGVHNFLYVFSPDKPVFAISKDDYLECYPGDNYVDVLALDSYGGLDNTPTGPYMTWKYETRRSLATIVDLANSKGKVAALSEVGPSNGLSFTNDSHWFVDQLLDLVKNDREASQIAYCLVWADQGLDGFWVPYPGQRNVQDFIDFYNDPYTVFQNDLMNTTMYQDRSIPSYSASPAFQLNIILQAMNWGMFTCIIVIYWKKGMPHER